MRYVYAPDTNAPGPIQNLPASWKDPVTGLTYTNFPLRSEEELNTLGWYACDEVFPTTSEFEIRTDYLIVFNASVSRFDVVWNKEYRSLEDCKDIKTSMLDSELQDLFVNTFGTDKYA